MPVNKTDLRDPTDKLKDPSNREIMRDILPTLCLFLFVWFLIISGIPSA